METPACKDSRLYSIIVLYDMHSGFFHKALEGLSDDAAHSRLQTKANHVAWLTGSLVQQRFELAELFGKHERQAAHELFVNNQGIKDDYRYPPISGFKKDWDKITPILRDVLQAIPPEKSDEIFEAMPDMKMSYFDMISFCTYREANCIGQIALYRRLLGYDAINYM